jgi:hypothetical protein
MVEGGLDRGFVRPFLSYKIKSCPLQKMRQFFYSSQYESSIFGYWYIYGSTPDWLQLYRMSLRRPA